MVHLHQVVVGVLGLLLLPSQPGAKKTTTRHPNMQEKRPSACTRRNMSRLAGFYYRLSISLPKQSQQRRRKVS